MKKCIKCGELKPLTEFYKNYKMKDGHLNSCKVCQEKYMKKNAVHITQLKNNWVKKNPKKVKVWHLVRKALSKGKLIKKPCEICGCEHVQGHHHNYDKPLDVTWLCTKHHGETRSKDDRG